MLPTDIRQFKARCIEVILRNMKNIRAEWQKDAEVPGAQSTEQFPYTSIKFMVTLAEQWLASENELLELETYHRV